jgi:Icc-related predicted phosphoesterase
VKLLAVSDLVVDGLYAPSVRTTLGPVAGILSCGDLPMYYLDFLMSMLNVPLYYVYGNHDMGFEYNSSGEIVRGVAGGENLHGRALAFRGLLLAGLEGARRYRPDAVHQYSEPEMAVKAARLALRLAFNVLRYGRALDVLVTHAPPLGIHDGPDAPHLGFRSFRALLRAFRPRYHLHGHKHVYRADQPVETRFGATTVVNVYPFRVLDIEVPVGRSG